MQETQLQNVFLETPQSRKILNCIQCGTCSASCPLTDVMDYAPRALFALIRDGEMTCVLQSNTPWYCVSCYQCVVRCPQEIPVIDLMYTLKRLSVETRQAPSAHKLPDLYHAFYQEVTHHGKISATFLLARYGIRHPGDMLSKIALGVKLLQRRRLELLPQKVKNPPNIAKLLKP